jgi:ribosome assembly protein YihI (activator of Der GTPase)
MRSATVVVGEVRLTVSEERKGGREGGRERGREGGREGAREDGDEALTLRRQKKERKAPFGTA